MVLHGITWDHARGYLPLIAVSKEYHRLHPDVQILWKKRSLKDFEDFPIEKLVDLYDFIMIDHPYMTEALEKKLLLPLNNLLHKECLQVHQAQSVGPSYESYWSRGILQALPVDAATQVAAYRPDRFSEEGCSVPTTFDGVLHLADQLGSHGYIGACMAPTHLFSTYMSLSAQQLGPEYFDPEAGIEEHAGAYAASCIYQLKSRAHPKSFEMDPIQTLDEMASGSQIVYAPYVYGYVNYALYGYSKHRIKFTNAPLLQKDAPASTQLGGVGICITNRVKADAVAIAVDFLEYLTSQEIQQTTYARNNGQPALMSAWMDAKNNAQSLDFYSGTLQTMQKSVLRPKVARWNAFQEAASKQMFQQVCDGTECSRIASSFNQLYRKIVITK